MPEASYLFGAGGWTLSAKLLSNTLVWSRERLRTILRMRRAHETETHRHYRSRAARTFERFLAEEKLEWIHFRLISLAVNWVRSVTAARWSNGDSMPVAKLVEIRYEFWRDQQRDVMHHRRGGIRSSEWYGRDLRHRGPKCESCGCPWGQLPCMSRLSELYKRTTPYDNP